MEDLNGTSWWYDAQSRGVWGPTMGICFRDDGTVSVSLTEPVVDSDSDEPASCSIQAEGSYSPCDGRRVEIELDRPVRGRCRFAGHFCLPDAL
jgi:hypothetical protein